MEITLDNELFWFLEIILILKIILIIVLADYRSFHFQSFLYIWEILNPTFFIGKRKKKFVAMFVFR
jgi:hypothetical protein